MEYGTNPLTGMDHPDPDVIRVNDTYYMINTTMHFFPGAEILRSYDLIHWEICTYIYDHLEHTAGEQLVDENTIYGHGMWAASLRYHNGKFYVVFIAHEWNRTFLFTSYNIEGPWKKQYIEGIYHDPSLLFDDDGRTYIVYGNRDIRLTELNDDLTAPKKDGLDRIIIRDAPGKFLGYEGSHIYKINGKYVLFLIHSKQQKWYRTQACFITDDLEGLWAGGDVMEADLDGMHSGPAQGGIVDTPDGKWFSVVFQDRGAIGRIPVLVPITWNESGYPVFGEVTKEISNERTRPGYVYSPLYSDDDFNSPTLKNVWQFNHEPHNALWETGNGHYRITTDKLSRTVEYARNTITQRTVLPSCTAEVTISGADMNNGDVGGLCALIGNYALIGLTKDEGKYYIVMKAKSTSTDMETESARQAVSGDTARLRADIVFTDNFGTVNFRYMENGEWKVLGTSHRIDFSLAHFTGARFGLFMYSTSHTYGSTSFSEFRYITP